MRIDILAVGSRGDVQPYVALGLGLAKAGHRVRLVTLSGFEDVIAGRGIDHLTIGDSPRAIAQTTEGKEWVKKRGSALGFLRGFVGVARSKVEEGIANYWAACQGQGADAAVDAIIVSPLGFVVGVQIAERLRVPVIRAQLAPPSLPSMYDWDGKKGIAAAFERGRAAFLDVAFNLTIWNVLRDTTNAARARILQLPPLPRLWLGSLRTPMLCGYSPAVVTPAPDFRSSVHVTGYWFLEESPAWVPSKELQAFLDAGPPPVFVGFGSTPFPNPEAANELVLQALKRSGHRAILVSGGSGLGVGQLDAGIFSVDFVPHSWLFSRVCAAVHQAGAGVTGLALRFGLPSVTVPVFADQPTWARRVFQLGVGPAPIPAKQLTAESLAAAIRATADPQMRRRAQALGKQIQREDGVTRAVQIIEAHMGSAATGAPSYQYAH
jgi:UDP:flavonoid glycosyltransferase YjiC (YdhE family)